MRSAFSRVFFVCACAFFTVWAVRQYPKLPAKTKAEWCMLRTDYKGAITHWNTRLEQDPTDVNAVLRLAECFDKLGDEHTAFLIYGTVSDYLTSSKVEFGQRYHRDRYLALKDPHPR